MDNTLQRRRGLLLVAVALVLTAIGLMWHDSRRAATSASSVSSASPAATPAGMSPTPMGSAGATGSSSPSLSAISAGSETASTVAEPVTHLHGAALCRAWLRAYLNRPKGTHDTSWEHAITGLSDPALVQTLTAAAANNPVGLNWAAWQVVGLKQVQLSGAPVSTSTRDVSNWLVTLSPNPAKSKATAQRLYTLIAYKGQNGWTVAQAQQGYTSNG